MPRSQRFTILFFLMVATGIANAGLEEELRQCRALDEATARMACYDAMGSGLPTAPLAVPPQPGAGPAPSAVAPRPTSADDERALSRLDRYWELRQESQRGVFVMLPFRANYILPASYNFSPNQVPFTDTGFEVEDLEVKFQFSFKFKLWQDLWGSAADLWFGYTQQSYWQLWDQESSPFRETNYEPTAFVGFPVEREILGLRARLLTLGFTHQSNGRGEPLSRSWNRIVGSALFERGHLIGQVRAWYRIPEDPAADDNPDITDYLGHGDISLSYVRGGNEWSTSLKNITSPDRGGIELGWSFSLGRSTPARGYIQYYYGYGENLLDYNDASNRISVGFLVNDWF